MELFKVCTYNCKNFNGLLKAEYIASLLVENDFVCLQEHHLFQSEFCKFEQLLNGNPLVMYTGTSMMDPFTFHRGRKYGGTAILWKSTIQCTVTPIQTSSKRLTSVLVSLENKSKLLLCCVYMPCDEGFRGANLSEYQDVLNEISTISQEHDGNAICLAGDFNTDVSRHSPQTTELLDFCENENLQLLVKNNISSVDYTFESACGSKSGIVQIIVTDTVQPN